MGDCFSIDSRTRGTAMPKSYSCDLRQRVIGMVEAGASRHEAAEHFGVSVSSVVKWMQRWNESRSMVVIDNCRAHMSPRVREVIERTGATTRSRWLTANSSNSSGAPKRERLQRFAERFDRSCRPLVLKNAPIT